MRKNKLLTLLVSFASLCVLSGCKNGNNNNQPSGQDTTVTKADEIKINSLYEGFVALYQTKNYTLEVIHTYGTYREEIPDMIFTKDYVGFDGKSFEELSVYFNDGTGVFRVSYTDDFQSGEYLKDKLGVPYTTLWDPKNASCVPTMYGACPEYIKEEITPEISEIDVTNKQYKIRFMQTIIGNTNDFAAVDSLTAKYENGKVIFNLVINGGAHSYKVTLKNVGNTKSSHIELFLKNNGKVFVPNEDLSAMRRLLNLDNFVQRIMLINEGTNTWAGFYFFTEHYMFQTGNDYSVGNAYMEFNYKDDPTLDNDFDMWGIYLVNVTRDSEDHLTAGLASGRAYNSDTLEVEECCRYPSRKLKLLNNLEYVKTGEVRDAHYDESEELFKGTPKKYYFVEETLVKNFCNNFGLDTSFEDVIFNTIAIEIDIQPEDKDSMVVFHAIGYYPGDGITYDYIIPLYGFGDANRTVLDTIYTQYNNNNN